MNLSLELWAQTQPTVPAELARRPLPGPVTDRIIPGRFIIDPPTLENLGFRWYIQGDSNRNASVSVSYREKGEQAWKQAQPMLRVHHEVVNQAYGPYRTGNLFAGSIMFLEPATEYEVRFVMDDADGGAPPPKIVSVVTRGEPRAFAPGRKLHVYPAGFKGNRLPDSFRDIEEAYAEAEPGDVLLLHAGVYRAKQTYTLTRSGTDDKPIIFRGGIGGEVIIEGQGHEADLFNIEHADYLTFEDLTLRRARMAIQAGTKGGPGASGLVVRRCRIEDVIYGINTTSENSTGWYIVDNVIIGINLTWFPRPEKGYMSPSHTGVNVYGRGHVVCYNHISKFSDNLAIANFGPPVEEADMHPVAIDFYRNELSFSQDDAVEADYGAHNVRVYRNRCYNTHTGLSVQPLYGGPVYLIRNELYSVTSLTFKLHNYCAGILAYHNTLACAGPGFLSFNRWQNGHFRNNLILGGKNFKRPDGRVRVAYAMDTGTITDYSTLDYNGYRANLPEHFIRWYDGRQQTTYRTLADFSRATGHERHGIIVDYDIFRRVGPPGVWTTYAPGQYDLRLKPGSAAVDAGMVLPNVNDDYSGRAPDLGCYELEVPLPHYGPRGARER